MLAYVDGDTAAFRTLFERYLPLLLGVSRRALRSDEDAHDVVQQTFVQLHAARFDFRRDARLRPWLMTITMNLIRQHFRKRSRKRELPLLEFAPELAVNPPLPGYREAQQRRLRTALQGLPEAQRQVVELHWLQERSFAEVAKIVGASEGAVRVRAHRAYKKLKDILGSHDA